VAELEIPKVLPFNLSASAFDLYLKCPEKFRRRHIEGEREAFGPPALLGSAFHAAEGENFQQKIETAEDLDEADVLDVYSDEFDERTENDDIDWGSEKQGDVKDVGVKLVSLYHSTLAPLRMPTHVERRYELRFPDVEWLFTGYIDLETDEGECVDYKTRSSRMNAAAAKSETQPRANLLARRAEGNPATFSFDTLVKNKTPVVDTIPVPVTDRELDQFVTRIMGVAAEIAWRMEYDQWQGAVPGAWWCSEKWCGFWADCPMGGG
jgi:hypothetical protein